MIECYGCHESKDEEQFSWRRIGEARQSQCKKCACDWAKKYRKNTDIGKKLYAERYARILEFKNHPCADCGNRFHPCCMDFDHVRGKKKYNINRMTSHKWEKVLEEIAKCDLVCANCHRIRTNIRRSV